MSYFPLEMTWAELAAQIFVPMRAGGTMLAADLPQPLVTEPWTIAGSGDSDVQLPELPEVVGFSSSGTTGEAKIRFRTRTQVMREVDVLTMTVSPRNATELVCFAPVNHIFGFLCGLMFARFHGIRFTFCPQLLAGQAGGRSRGAGKIIVTLPSSWHALLRSTVLASEQLTIIHSAGPVPQEARAALRLPEYAEVTLNEIFGSTETGAIGFRKNASSDDALWTLLDDVDLDHTVLESTVPLRVNSPRCSNALTSECETHADLQFVETGDLVALASRRTFRRVGRQANLIKVNGVNLSLDDLATELSSRFPNWVIHPIPVDDGIRGQSFELIVEDAVGAPELHYSIRREVGAFLRERLGAHVYPTRIVFRNALERTPTGKLRISPQRKQKRSTMLKDSPAATARLQCGASTTGELRGQIVSNDLSFLMEAHDALSATIAGRAGFRGLWASGLSISSSLGYRDANEAAWTQVADVVERMADAAGVPILVDGDSGFGNFNNARHTTLKLWQRGAAGICVEDKCFPKMNSFVGDRHPLAETEEFCGRLRAIKDTVPDPEFVLVARVEALIAGRGEAEALDRAHAYADAGADAILIHSRRSDPDEILSFARTWANRRPLVIVPTKYYRTPTSAYRDAGISTVIWANHSMRAAVAAMRAVCSRILAEEGVAGVESEIASLREVFDLLNYDELTGAEERYLPAAVSI